METSGKSALVYLLRHAEPMLPDQSRRFLGARSDPPLSEAGVQAARQVEARLAHVVFDSVWSSGQVRSVQTAEIVSGLPPSRILIERRLREIDLGTWDGLSAEEVQARYAHQWAERELDVAGYRYPGGETYAELQARAVPALLELAENAMSSPNRCALAVSHKGTNRALLGYFLGLPLDRIFSIKQDYGAVNVLEVTSAASARPRVTVLEQNR